MFFVLSKSVAFLLAPSNLLVLAALLGFALMLTRRRRLGKWLAGVAIALLLAIAYLPLGHALTRPLENRFPSWDGAHGPPDGIVVLGGAINPGLSRIRGVPQLNGGAERVTAIAKLAREYPDARIVYSGGDASLFATEGAEANYVYPLLDSFGVPRARVRLETRSRNTYENATFSKALAKPKAGERWLLVTSAKHMPRAVGCFRRAGFPVEPYPVDWRTPPRVRFGVASQFGGGLVAFDSAVHEWLGLLTYWLVDRSSAFFPGPLPAR